MTVEKLFVLIFSLSFFRAYAIDAQTLFQRVLQAAESVENIECYSKMIERSNGKIISNTSFSRISYNPFRVYMTNIAPPGMQILYNPKQTEQKLFIKMPLIAFITFKFKPQDPMVRNNNHHPIEYSGTRFAARILRKISENPDDYTLSLSQGSFYQRPVFIAVFNATNFHYRSFTLQKDVPLQDFCSDLLINEYLVIKHNKSVRSYQQILKKGMKILIPSHFFKKLEVWVDQENYLPMVEKIWDEKGLLEEYNMYQIKVRDSFPPEVFLPKSYSMN